MVWVVRLVAQSDRPAKGRQAGAEIRDRRRGRERGEIGRHYVVVRRSGVTLNVGIMAGVCDGGNAMRCGRNECDNTGMSNKRFSKLTVTGSASYNDNDNEYGITTNSRPRRRQKVSATFFARRLIWLH